MAPITRLLIATNVAVFLLQAAAGGLLETWFALWPPGHGFDLAARHLRLPSRRACAYLFQHARALHVRGDIERLFGSPFFLRFYFASVISAALCQLAVISSTGGPPFPTLGASGGVYGLLLAFGIYYPRRMVMLIFPPIPMQARFFVILFAAVELVLGVTGTQAGVAHFAHLGGMLGGWLMIQYRRRGFPFTPPR
jgi:membrane associated rhomboid family serine protease